MKCIKINRTNKARIVSFYATLDYPFGFWFTQYNYRLDIVNVELYLFTQTNDYDFTRQY